jgi:hypothetical protein
VQHFTHGVAFRLVRTKCCGSRKLAASWADDSRASAVSALYAELPQNWFCCSRAASRSCCHAASSSNVPRGPCVACVSVGTQGVMRAATFLLHVAGSGGWVVASRRCSEPARQTTPSAGCPFHGCMQASDAEAPIRRAAHV